MIINMINSKFRKELMSWRFERSAGLTRLLDVVIKTFGVDNIDIR